MLNVKKLLTKILSALNKNQGNVTVTCTGTVVRNQVFKIGPLCFLYLALNAVTGLTSRTWNEVATLPSGFVPDVNAEMTTFVGGEYGFVAVRTDGKVYIQPTVSGSLLIRVIVPYFVGGGTA